MVGTATVTIIITITTEVEDMIEAVDVEVEDIIVGAEVGIVVVVETDDIIDRTSL